VELAAGPLLGSHAEQEKERRADLWLRQCFLVLHSASRHSTWVRRLMQSEPSPHASFRSLSPVRKTQQIQLQRLVFDVRANSNHIISSRRETAKKRARWREEEGRTGRKKTRRVRGERESN
jgi:hypothetical protein